MKLHVFNKLHLPAFGAGIVLTGALAACNPMAVSKDVNSRYYSIPSGSKLILHQDLKVPAGKAHINIQHGRTAAGLDNWTVGCELEVRKLGPGVVTADTFIITRAEVSREWVNRPSTMRFYRTLYLESDTQPNVMNMECQYWSYPLHGDTIPVSEMREALGGVATLEFAQ
ncbi:MAG: hypothetical protein WBP44_15455 [Gammaproteobacteria bacterium]